MGERSYTPLYDGDGEYALLGLTREEAYALLGYMDGRERGVGTAVAAQEELVVGGEEDG